MRAVLKQQALKNSEWTSGPLALWFHYVSAKRDAGQGYGDPLHCSCLENPLERGTWWAIAHRVTESDTTEKALHTDGLDVLLSSSIPESAV